MRELYPSTRFSQDGREVIVQNEAEDHALGDGWTNGDPKDFDRTRHKAEVQEAKAVPEKHIFPSTRFHQNGHSVVVRSPEEEAEKRELGYVPFEELESGVKADEPTKRNGKK